jgi:ABC-type multidrug transport system fused ATPase/permease subunit
MATLLVALIVVAAGLDLVVPFVTQHLIDTLINSFKSGGAAGAHILVSSAIAILLATAFTRAVRSLYTYQLFRTTTRIEDEVRYRAFGNYLELQALYHHDANSGQIVGRIDAGCAAVFTVLFDILGQNLVPPLVVFAGVLAALLAKSPVIALAVFLPLPLYLAVVWRLTHRIYEIEQQGCEDFEAVAKERYDVAGLVLTVKKFSQERAEVRRQWGLQTKARDTQFRGERLWTLVENSQSLISTAGRVAVILLAGWMVLSRRSTVGEFFLYITLAEMAYYPVSQLSVIFPRLRRSMARAERLFAILDAVPQVADCPGAIALEPLRHSVEFRDVWFRYADERDWTLRKINLWVPAGSTVALVGRSGSGKTTLMNLLLRMFDPQHGAILIDGVDIRDATQASVRGQMAVVPQEVDLFSRSVAQNIEYGRPGASPAEIEAAARTAVAHDFISRTEFGYGTVVGERGIKLSGGERQRIGIARAVLRNPRILILDEATSHLDSESERLIQQATERVIEGRTAFVIAHRLSTVLDADLIAVFDAGTLEAIGTHPELLESSPTYQRLYWNYMNAAEPLAEPEPEPEPAAPQ